MYVKFSTKLDWYQDVSWPVLDVVPRIGECVKVHPGSLSYCKENNIPDTLVVVNVTYNYDMVVCELWYTKETINTTKLTPTYLSHLLKQSKKE